MISKKRMMLNGAVTIAFAAVVVLALRPDPRLRTSRHDPQSLTNRPDPQSHPERKKRKTIEIAERLLENAREEFEERVAEGVDKSPDSFSYSHPKIWNKLSRESIFTKSGLQFFIMEELSCRFTKATVPYDGPSKRTVHGVFRVDILKYKPDNFTIIAEVVLKLKKRDDEWRLYDVERKFDDESVKLPPRNP